MIVVFTWYRWCILDFTERLPKQSEANSKCRYLNALTFTFIISPLAQRSNQPHLRSAIAIKCRQVIKSIFTIKNGEFHLQDSVNIWLKLKWLLRKKKLKTKPVYERNYVFCFQNVLLTSSTRVMVSNGS